MNSLSSVVWSEGMYLGPHHFQAQNRYFEDSVHFVTSNLWADSFGNLTTNVTQEDFGRGLAFRPFQIKGKGWKIDRLSRTYGEEKPGQPMALFGSGGRLEISVNQGNALDTLGLKPGEAIAILWG